MLKGIVNERHFISSKARKILKYKLSLIFQEALIDTINGIKRFMQQNKVEINKSQI